MRAASSLRSRIRQNSGDARLHRIPNSGEFGYGTPTMRIASLMQSLARWLRSDRIRIAPSDGAILRLTSDAVIVFRDVAFRVTARRVVSLASGAVVVYDCESERSRCQLRVEPASPRTRVVFIDAGEETPLAADDVEIFPSQGVCR